MPHRLNRALLLELRRRMGFTQTALAQACNVSLKTVKRWEAVIAQPYPVHLSKRSKLFSLERYSLLFEEHFDVNDPTIAARLKRKERLYDLVAFEIDGTLIVGDGFEFSWKEVWRALQGDENLRSSWMREYRLGHITYDEWCHRCVAEFRRIGCHTRHSDRSG